MKNLWKYAIQIAEVVTYIYNALYNNIHSTNRILYLLLYFYAVYNYNRTVVFERCLQISKTEKCDSNVKSGRIFREFEKFIYRVIP